jgi:GAF domain-containing protein
MNDKQSAAGSRPLSFPNLQKVWTAAKEVQQENDRLQAELAQLRQENERLHQSESRYRQLFENAPDRTAQERAKLLSTVVQVANLLLRSPDYSTVLPNVVRLLGEAVGSDRCCLVQNVTDSVSGKPGVRLHTEWCRTGIPSTAYPHQGEYTLLWEDFPDFQTQPWAGEIVQFEIAHLSPTARDLFSSQGNVTMLAVPIMVAGQFWGVFGFDYCQTARSLDLTEQAVFAIAVDSIAAAIERQAKEDALRQAQQSLLQAEKDRVVELAEVNQLLRSSLDRLAADPKLDAFLGHVLIEISEQLDIYAVSLHLYDPDSQTLRLNNWIEAEEDLFQSDPSRFEELAKTIQIGEAAIWDVLLQTKAPFVITRENADQFMFPGTQDWQLRWADRYAVQSGINILLMLGETPLGLLGLFSAQRSEFTSEELELAQALAQQATLAIQLT